MSDELTECRKAYDAWCAAEGWTPIDGEDPKWEIWQAAWNRRQPEAKALTMEQLKHIMFMECIKEICDIPDHWRDELIRRFCIAIHATMPPDQNDRIKALEADRAALVAALEEIKTDLKAPLQLEMPFEKAVRSALKRTDNAIARIRGESED